MSSRSASTHRHPPRSRLAPTDQPGTWPPASTRRGSRRRARLRRHLPGAEDPVLTDRAHPPGPAPDRAPAGRHEASLPADEGRGVPSPDRHRVTPSTGSTWRSRRARPSVSVGESGCGKRTTAGDPQPQAPDRRTDRGLGRDAPHRRPGRGDVPGQDLGDRRRQQRVRPPHPPVHAGPAVGHPDPGSGEGTQPDTDPVDGRSAQPANPPSGCKFRTRCFKIGTLTEAQQQRCVSEMPALLPVVGADHTSACHYNEERSVV